MWFCKEKDPFEIVKELKTWTNPYTLHEIKVSIVTEKKNFVMILKDKITSCENMEADLGRGMHHTNSQYQEYLHRCIRQYAIDYINTSDLAERRLRTLLASPGAMGHLVLPDSEEDGLIKHSIRCHDIESVRVIWVKKTEILLRKAEVRRLK